MLHSIRYGASMGAVAVLSKRMLRKPMTEGDLSALAAGIIANPPISPELREVLAGKRYTDGVSYLETWRDEAKQLLHNIAAEKSWALQKHHLLKMAVAANGWIALRNGVGMETRTSLWKSYVERVGEFATNASDQWPTILQKIYVFALLQDAICMVLGRACYGTKKAADNLKFYRGIRQSLIEKDITLTGRICDLDETHPHLAELMMDARNRIAYPASKEAFDFVRAVGDRIAASSFDPADALRRWPEISEHVNAALLAMKADAEAAYARR